MPTKLNQWDQLPGQVIRSVHSEEGLLRFEFENGHAEFRASEPDMPILVERPDGNTSSAFSEWDRLHGKKIGAVNVTFFSETFSDRSSVKLTFEDGFCLVLRSNISYVPVKLA